MNEPSMFEDVLGAIDTCLADSPFPDNIGLVVMPPFLLKRYCTSHGIDYQEQFEHLGVKFKADDELPEDKILMITDDDLPKYLQ